MATRAGSLTIESEGARCEAGMSKDKAAEVLPDGQAALQDAGARFIGVSAKRAKFAGWQGGQRASQAWSNQVAPSQTKI
jgi:hypothetical protein